MVIVAHQEVGNCVIQAIRKAYLSKIEAATHHHPLLLIPKAGLYLYYIEH